LILTATQDFPLKILSVDYTQTILLVRKKTFLPALEVDEDELNKIERETREQVSSERWKGERQFRLTASRFHLISR